MHLVQSLSKRYSDVFNPIVINITLGYVACCSMRKIFILLLFILNCNTAFADAASDMHRQSAFIFAGRKDWNDAIEHARLAHSTVLVKYFTWEYLKDPQSGATFDEITRFIKQNPDWPDQNVLEKRAEVALMAGNPTDEMLKEWFSTHPPITDQGKIKMAKDQEALHIMIRNAWVNDNYDKNTEEKILAKYHSILRPVDHIRRVDRLIWEGNYDEAKRLLKYIPKDYQRVFQARVALAEDKFYAPASLLRVPKAFKNDPGLTYERIRWRVRANDKDGVRELLLTTPNEVPYPEKWWPIRDRQIREALSEGDVATAERLLARAAQKPGTVSYKEVLWLKGWIDLEFRHSADTAYKMFVTLLQESETPAGKAKAAYWAGRAAQKIVKSNPARWFGEASTYSTTFYGQLAEWELHKDDQNRHGHIIKSHILPTREERTAYKRHELVQLVYELAAANQTDTAGRFINYLVQNAPTSNEMILAVELGRDIRRIDFSVRAAKKALQDDIVVLEDGWPVVQMPGNLMIEKPLVLALSRQESEFNENAVSPSGACGLMQLLPATARETARKSGFSYSSDRLFDPEYNMTIGSHYMNKLVDKFNGSYVLAVAAYNAGPYRVEQWINAFGRPSRDVHEVTDWIEEIPTAETRNYVQHVFENMEVYRFLLAEQHSVSTMIADDMVRLK